MEETKELEKRTNWKRVGSLSTIAVILACVKWGFLPIYGELIKQKQERNKNRASDYVHITPIGDPATFTDFYFKTFYDSSSGKYYDALQGRNGTFKISLNEETGDTCLAQVIPTQ